MRSFASVILIVCALVGCYFAALALSAAKSAIHEIEGLIGVLIVTAAAAAGYIGAPSGEKNADEKKF